MRPGIRAPTSAPTPAPNGAQDDNHHRVPYADDGAASVENIELRCRAHNQYEAEQWFGPLLVREAPAAFVADR
jgi:hypothetical protein